MTIIDYDDSQPPEERAREIYTGLIGLDPETKLRLDNLLKESPLVGRNVPLEVLKENILDTRSWSEFIHTEEDID